MAGLILYLDPWAGVSGDMLLAALLDTDRATGGLDEELQRVISALGLPATTIEIVRDVEWGLACTRVVVRAEGTAPLRHLAEMEQIIGSARLSEWVRERATAAVRRLASVEAAIHGCPVDQIHFHEVGAVDTLVDVVGAFALVEALGVSRVVVGAIPVGGGTVEIAHGRMGVPAPATTRLLEGYEIVGGPEMRELTTPTGALLLAELRAEQGALPPMRPQQVGYGAGSMKLEHGPNVLRAVVGSADVSRQQAERVPGGANDVLELQTNLDDASPEIVGHVARLLREAGALDVWTVPAYMKKDRPGVVLHALVGQDGEAAATALIFEQTGSLGVRRQVVSRHIADRGWVSVSVSGMPVRVKWGRWRGRLVSVSPEYEDAAGAALASGLPLRAVMDSAVAGARQLLG